MILCKDSDMAFDGTKDMTCQRSIKFLIPLKMKMLYDRLDKVK